VRIPEHIVEQVREQADIVEIIGEHVRLKKAGRNYLGLCPFHPEKTPSFNVNPERGIYKCFGCGKAGNVITFVSEHQHLTFVDTVKHLAQRLGIVIPDEERDDPNGMHARRDAALAALREASTIYTANLETPTGKAARSYFAQRGFSDETIAAFRLGFAVDSWDFMLQHLRAQGYTDENIVDSGLMVVREDGRMYDRFRGRAMFAISDDQGRVVGFSARILEDAPGQPKYINSPQCLVYDKGRVLYGLDLAKRAIRETQSAILVEGQADVVSLHQHGFHRTIASSGTALTPTQAATIKRYAREVVLLFDADEAGQKASTRGIETCLAAGLSVRVVTLPSGSDPDSIVRNDGSEVLQEILDGALPWIRWQSERAKLTGEASDSAGRSRILRMMLLWIAAVPDTLERPFLVRDLADAFRVQEAMLLKELEAVSAAPAPHAPSTTYVQQPPAPSAPVRVDTSTLLLAPERELLRVAIGAPHGLAMLMNTYDVTEETFVTLQGRRLFSTIMIASEEHPDVVHHIANDSAIHENDRNELVGLAESISLPSLRWLRFDVEIPGYDVETLIRAALTQLRFAKLTSKITEMVAMAETITDIDEQQRVYFEMSKYIQERQRLSVFNTEPLTDSESWQVDDRP